MFSKEKSFDTKQMIERYGIKEMALLAQWKEVAYNEKLGSDKLQQFWGAYFMKEKEISGFKG